MRKSTLFILFMITLSSLLFFSGCDKKKNDEYSITINPIAHGTITVNKDSAKEGAAIILTVEPDDGYILKDNSLKYNDEIITNDVYFFEMPAKNVVINAEFVEKVSYTITTTIIGNGNIVLSKSSAFSGEKIQLDIEAHPGYVLKENTLKYNGFFIEDSSFIMPAENVVITAEFIEANILKKSNQLSNFTFDSYYVLEVLNNTLSSANSPTYIRALAFKEDNTFYDVMIMTSNTFGSLGADLFDDRDYVGYKSDGTYIVNGDLLILHYANNSSLFGTQAKIVGSTLVFEQKEENATDVTITTSTYKYYENSRIFNSSTTVEYVANKAYLNGNEVNLSQVYSDYHVYESIKGNVFRTYYKHNNDTQYAEKGIINVGNYFYFRDDVDNNCFEIIDDNTIVLTLRKSINTDSVVLVKIVYTKTI